MTVFYFNPIKSSFCSSHLKRNLLKLIDPDKSTVVVCTQHNEDAMAHIDNLFPPFDPVDILQRNQIDKHFQLSTCLLLFLQTIRLVHREQSLT